MMAYSNLQMFAVELVGTFVLVVFATGSIVHDAQVGGLYGVWIAAAAPFVALIIGVYSFGRISMAHFNPAVTIGYYITGHITRIQIAWYFAAEMIGALLGSLFVMGVIGSEADLGANAPSPDYPLSLVFPVEVLASALLMAVVFAVVYTEGAEGVQRDCNRRNSGAGHTLPVLHIRGIDEPCKGAGARAAFRNA